jgi:hypothetical protein
MRTKTQREILRALSDMYTFVRSVEVNRAVQAVTFTQLIREQIDRNGDTERSNKSQYDPYGYRPDAPEPAAREPLARANFLSGTDTNQPTKLDRILAIQNNITALVQHVKAMDIVDVTSPPQDESQYDQDLLHADEDLFGGS